MKTECIDTGTVFQSVPRLVTVLHVITLLLLLTGMLILSQYYLSASLSTVSLLPPPLPRPLVWPRRPGCFLRVKKVYGAEKRAQSMKHLLCKSGDLRLAPPETI